MQNKRLHPGPGQESVWDYPRPPRLEVTSRHIEVFFNGELIAETDHPLRVLETSHPPVYYISPADVQAQFLISTSKTSFCEWKGWARYYSVQVAGRVAENAAWHYPEPVASFAAIRDHIAFYPGMMDACFVDGERVKPQPGGFYGGWITKEIVGPFKGGLGTIGWWGSGRRSP